MRTALLLLLVAGCTSQATSSYLSAGQSNSRAQGYIQAADSHVKAAIPHADTTGKSYLNAATQDLDHALQDATATEHSIQEATKAAQKIEQDNAKMKADFWSPRQRQIMRLLVIATAIGAVLFLVVGHYFAGLGIPALIQGAIGLFRRK